MSAGRFHTERLPASSSSEDSLRLSAQDRDHADIVDAVNWLIDVLTSDGRPETQESRELESRLWDWQIDAVRFIRQ